MTNQDIQQKLLDKLKYYACSLRERLLIFHFLKTHPEVNVKDYSSWSGFTIFDAIISSGTSTNNLVEVKFREFKSKQFKTTFIEPKKFNNLRELSYTQDQPVQYWNFYSKDGVLEVFDLNHVEWYETEKKRTGKDCFESLVDDESTVYELDKQFASYYHFDKSINYELLAKNELISRLNNPELNNEIRSLDLSKYQSYLLRKNNIK